jgi:glycosyltransferase involved in cell wall biosynthesis
MISILLPVYNGEKFISQSIDSILNQTFKNFELLIGFNGTTDNSIDIASSYKDNRIKIFNYTNEKGKAKTLNKLLSESKYELVALQDDDDIWLDNKIEQQLHFINDFDVIGTLIKYIDENNKIIGAPNLSTDSFKITQLSLSGDNQIANSSALIKKICIFKAGGWSEDLDKLAENGVQPCEDFDLWLKMIKKNKKFINVSEYLVHHRIHSGSNFNTKKLNK